MLDTTSHRVEQIVESLGSRVKPYLPSISRFLIVVTFYEDAIRILYQWNEQHLYLDKVRSFPSLLASFFLGFNVLSMLFFSTCIITKRRVGLSVGVLTGVVLGQTTAYGLLFDLVFFLRNLSVAGGLLMCLSESILYRRRFKSSFGSLPQLSEGDRHKYFLFAGRVLLVLLFVGFVADGEWNLVRACVSVISMAACAMIVVGFRAKTSATFLVTLLCVMNVLMNNWWAGHHSNYRRDFLKYDFFQALSITGGLLLLISTGPGGLSYDEKKKEF